MDERFDEMNKRFDDLRRDLEIYFGVSLALFTSVINRCY